MGPVQHSLHTAGLWNPPIEVEFPSLTTTSARSDAERLPRRHPVDISLPVLRGVPARPTRRSARRSAEVAWHFVPASRPRLPTEYGVPAESDGMLAWQFVEDRLREAPNYWLATVGPGGVPHTRPVDGVWVDGALCFGGSPDTRWVRNLQANALASIHIPHDDDVVILEGSAEYVSDAEHPLSTPSQQASQAKYPQYYDEDDPPFQPFWVLRPAVVYAWTLEGFPRNVTRWRLG